MSFKLSSVGELSSPVRRAIQSLKDYVDGERGSVLAVTTTQRDALTPSVGLVVFNTTLLKHQGWDGTAWQSFY
jgi:hypothetical protein